MDAITRRTFIAGSAAGLVAGLPTFGNASPELQEPTAAKPAGDKVGWAILGLGGYAMGQILPNLKACERSRLVAVISGDRDKAKRVAGQYGLDQAKGVYTYDEMDRIKDNPEIQVVYVITPPGNHREFTERAAKAGKHVCCEKPMAPSVADCQAMIDACKKAGVLLQIGYRSHYEANNLRAMEACRKELGQIRSVTSDHGFNIGRGLWRTQKKWSGGGSMMDIGIYAVQALRYLSGEEPTEVYATWTNPPNDDRFKEVEDTVSFTLKFPSGAVGTGTSGYSWSRGVNRYMALGTNGRVDAEPATSYGGNTLRINYRPAEVTPNNQFAAQMDHLSECIQDKKVVRTPGEMGLQDIRIIQAIYDSCRTGRPVKL